MSNVERLRQLRELAGRLERLPATEERDCMLRKVRERAVDIDTGVTTRPFAAPRSARKRAVPVSGGVAQPSRVAPFTGWCLRGGSRVPLAMPRSSDVLAAGERLCLEDLPVPAASHGSHAHGAWERGLRG